MIRYAFKRCIFLSLWIFPFILQSQEKLSLHACIEIALKNNLQFEETRLNKRQKEADLVKDKLALLPDLSLNASQGFNYGRTIDPFSDQFVERSITSRSFSLNSGLVLFKGLQKQNNLKQSRELLRSSHFAMARTQNEIRLQTLTYYLQILMEKEKLAQAGSQVNSTLQLLNKTQHLVEAGKEPPSKNLEVKSQLASDRSKKVEQENQLKLARLDLKQYLNYPFNKELFIKDVNFSDSLPGPGANDPGKVISQNLDTLPEIREARSKMESNLYGLRAVKGSRSPSLQLNASINTGYSSASRQVSGLEYSIDTIGVLASNETPVITRRSVPNFTTTPFTEQLENNFGQILSLRMNFPLFNNGNIDHNIATAKIQYQKSRLTYLQKRQDVEQKIFRAFVDNKNAYRQYLAAMNQMKAQQELFKQSDLQYREGILNFFDWQSSKNNLDKAENNFLNAKYNYLLKKKIYEFYSGNPVNLRQ